MNRKFKQERSDFAAYLTAKHLSGYELAEPITDPPDIILFLNAKRIGIEHTRLINEFQMRWHQKCARMLKDCENKFGNDFPESVTISCEFRSSTDLNNKEIRSLKDKLYRTVLDQYKIIRNTDFGLFEIPSSLLPIQVKSISIVQNQSDSSMRWYHKKSWSVGPLKEEQLEKVITKKSTLVKKLDHEYDELWLFLVVIGEKYSDFSSVALNEFTLDKSCEFDKVILFNKKSIEICEHIKH